MPLSHIALSFAAIFALTGCSNQFEVIPNGIPNVSSSQNQDSKSGIPLQLELKGLEPMKGQHYEGWLVTDSGVISSGRFNVNKDNRVIEVDANGSFQSLLGENGVGQFMVGTSKASTFVLTIEPDGDTNPGASSVHYVAGGFNNGIAEATTDHAGALGVDFSAASGSYILATPTNGPTTHNQGIWFLDPTAGPGASLNLPPLDRNWAYEGWIVNPSTGEVISTGIFSDPSGADLDAGGAAAGANSAPPFPGQDFIKPAKVLNTGDYITVISVEPVPDFDPAPFTLKILKGDIAAGAPVTSSLGLDRIANDGDISIRATLN